MKFGFLFTILLIPFLAKGTTLICSADTKWGNLTGNKVLDTIGLCFDGCDLDGNDKFSVTIEDEEIVEVTDWRLFGGKPHEVKFNPSEVSFLLERTWTKEERFDKSKPHLEIVISRVSGEFHIQQWAPHLHPYDMRDSWVGKCSPGKKLF